MLIIANRRRSSASISKSASTKISTVYRLLAGVDLNANRCSAKIHFVPATVLPSNDGMRHLHLAPDKLDVITACVSHALTRSVDRGA